MYVCMYVRMYVCMYECMYVCMYVCIYVYMYVCMYVCTYICMCVCMYVCTYACMCACMHACMYVCTYVHTYVCMYVSTYACMYVYNSQYGLDTSHSHSSTRPHGHTEVSLQQTCITLLHCCNGLLTDMQRQKKAFLSWRGYVWSSQHRNFCHCPCYFLIISFMHKHNHFYSSKFHTYIHIYFIHVYLTQYILTNNNILLFGTATKMYRYVSNSHLICVRDVTLFYTCSILMLFCILSLSA